MVDRRQRFQNEKHEFHDPSILLGNWFNERARREADFREHVDLLSRKQLPIQKSSEYINALNKPVQWSESLDGFLRNGSTVGLAWNRTQIFLSVLPRALTPEGYYQQPCPTYGSLPSSIGILPTRAALKILRSDARIPDSVPIMNEECLLFKLVEPTGELFLNWESGDPMPIQRPRFLACSGSHALWKTVKCADSYYVKVNSATEVVHVASGHRLTLEENSPVNTVLGREWNISCRFDRQVSGMWRFVVPCHEPINLLDSSLLHSNIWKIWQKRT